MKQLRYRFLWSVGYVGAAVVIWGLIALGVILALLVAGWAIKNIVFLAFISIQALQGPNGFIYSFTAFCFGLVAAIQAWASDNEKK